VKKVNDFVLDGQMVLSALGIEDTIVDKEGKLVSVVVIGELSNGSAVEWVVE